jgi:hypothetical protein
VRFGPILRFTSVVLLFPATTTVFAAPAQSACAPEVGTRASADCTLSRLHRGVRGDMPDTDDLYAAAAAIYQRAGLHARDGDVDAMRAIMTELNSRHALRPYERRQFLDVLLYAGRLDEAHAVQADIPSKRDDVFPTRVTLAMARAPGEVRWFEWDGEAGVLREHALDLAHGSHILVQAGVDCHYCRDALRRISADATLSAAFRDHAVWYSRPDATTPASELAHWNALHPGVPLAVVGDMDGWPHEDTWRTPVFRFLRDGREVKTVLGWKSEQTVPQLREGMAAIGL